MSSLLKGPRYPVTFIFFKTVHHNMVILTHCEFYNCLYCQIWLSISMGRALFLCPEFKHSRNACFFVCLYVCFVGFFLLVITFQKLNFPPNINLFLSITIRINALIISLRNIGFCACMKKTFLKGVEDP